MTISAVIPQAPPDSYTRADLVAALVALQAFYATHGDAPLPGGPAGVVLNIRVPGGTRGEKLVCLAVIAELLGVQETKIPGGLAARRWFGPVLLEAHVRDEETPHEDYVSAAQARKQAAA